MIVFRIPGNQDNPKGNPIGYTRTTQGSKWTEKYKRYQKWKDYIWASFLKAEPKPPRFAGIKVSINCYIFYDNKDHRRPDPGNVVKGPAIIEAEYTTIVVPPHLQYVVDKYQIAKLVSQQEVS
ncbi:hypothetical protein LCGC14_3164580 [marine sediment metagenome]|uniref:Acetophenone carboxylase-like C-terminal domain-containing protein n=1 Tax=marine sediment metagenome TaxID=412755 RepID=A0A0F8WCZ9_9ZZZZ